MSILGAVTQTGAAPEAVEGVIRILAGVAECMGAVISAAAADEGVIMSSMGGAKA